MCTPEIRFHDKSKQSGTLDREPTIRMEIDAPTPVNTPAHDPTDVAQSYSDIILEMKEDATTLPKSNPPTSPNGPWVSAATDSTAYPRVSSYDFQVSTMKRVDRNLDVFFAGVMDPVCRKRWAFTIGTPSCLVSFANVAFEGEPKNSRVLISPNYTFNGSGSPDSSLFQEFMDHVEGISQRFKTMMQTYYDRDVSNWQSPFKVENGFIVGMQAKVKNDNIRQLVLAGSGHLKCVLKLTCVYFAKGRSGLSFELVEAHES